MTPPATVARSEDDNAPKTGGLAAIGPAATTPAFKALKTKANPEAAKRSDDSMNMTAVAKEIEQVAETKTRAVAQEETEESMLAPKQYKIALLAWESLHSIAVGGVAPHVTELAAGLERRGHEVHVFVRTGAGQMPYEMIDGVHVHRIAFELSSDFVQECANMCNSMVHFLCETEAFMAAEFDIVHCHDWLAAAALCNVKHNLNRKCVFTVHSTEYGRCGNNTYGGQSARIRGLEQEAIGLADRVIGVSGVLCDEVKGHYHFDWEKIRCVYNGINCLRYDGNLWDPAEVRGSYGVGPMDPMVLFVGRMATQKGPDILVDAIPSVLASRPDTKFVLVGDGYMKDGLVSRCHELGVMHAVRFTGSMGGQSLVDLFKATDIVAIPSRNEPFGIVTLEAWAASKPVVVTKSGGPREFVWHDNDGFLVDTSADGMAWGITQCVHNFDHAKYMGQRGRVKAAFQFSWDRIAEVTNNVYDELHGIFPPPAIDEKRKESVSEKSTVPLA
eukprot:CAMPEP_0198317102 /NCGR_PEP_ID=MMETSP1450-20131203/6707_1 /TAXON_ID=753684 ORGANISM="Madagascaria erythrocladiodes, Strain CCMP3234" /NCGR_SAMPLE_ID=MMETSP1450 /ASSEMBLY_ACC=CAM_ASM_001115 /LENGTH=500 /DNA_ID=CAMNT_0044020285 /DNA_START=141 /DNA_END=1643 /DNA_ORIENTATION=-